jgi:hypothetical protein
MAEEDLLTFLAKIQSQYPQAMAIITQPGVAAVYVQAVKEGWSGDRLEAALENTEWWKTSPAPVRAWQALQATDPATAAQKGADTKRLFDDISKQIGLTAPPDFTLFARAVSEGWDANRIKYELIATTNWGGGLYPQGGEIGASAATVNSMANDYGVPLSDQTKVQWGRQLAQGAITPDSVKGYLIEQAKSLYPGLTAALDQGITVKQYADPYIQLAQQETGLNPADVNLTDQKWMSLLNKVDPKTGARVSMSLDEALGAIRSDSAWGYDTSAQGRAAATQLADNLAKTFGATG